MMKFSQRTQHHDTKQLLMTLNLKTRHLLHSQTTGQAKPTLVIAELVMYQGDLEWLSQQHCLLTRYVKVLAMAAQRFLVAIQLKMDGVQRYTNLHHMTAQFVLLHGQEMRVHKVTSIFLTHVKVKRLTTFFQNSIVFSSLRVSRAKCSSVRWLKDFFLPQPIASKLVYQLPLRRKLCFALRSNTTFAQSVALVMMQNLSRWLKHFIKQQILVVQQQQSLPRSRVLSQMKMAALTLFNFVHKQLKLTTYQCLTSANLKWKLSQEHVNAQAYVLVSVREQLLAHTWASMACRQVNSQILLTWCSTT